MSVSEEKDSGFVTLSIKHRSPVYAKAWLDLLVVDINEALRAQDLAESERAVAYLEEQLKQTSVAEIRELLAGLLRSHMESRMMAAVEPNYVFSVIDPPTVPELKSEPKRALICVIGTLLGGMLGMVYSIVRRALRNRAEGLGDGAPGVAGWGPTVMTGALRFWLAAQPSRYRLALALMADGALAGLALQLADALFAATGRREPLARLCAHSRAIPLGAPFRGALPESRLLLWRRESIQAPAGWGVDSALRVFGQ